MKAAKTHLYYFPYLFDGLTERVFNIMNIIYLYSVKTPSKLRQNMERLTECDFFSLFFIIFLTEISI